MGKRQTYALAGSLVGTGAPFGALVLQYLTTRPWGAPLPFVDAQWSAHPFFYWYMLLSTCLVLSGLGY
ncbi:MAG TPA: hypothetical protein VFR02_10540, partial [bacterium]|nr:hypothetical protein [bacterium]